MVKQRLLESGVTLFLQDMAFGNKRLSIGDEITLWSNYCYKDVKTDAAVQAFETWDGEGDPPEGWYRHIETGRRRPDFTVGSEETWA